MASLDGKQILEQMERLPAPARYGVLAAVALSVLVVYWFTLYDSERQRLQVFESQLTQLQSEINEARVVASNLATFESKQGELRAKLEAALQRLPNSQELPVLLTDISGLGKKSGLEIRSFTPAGEINRGFYAEVPIKVEFYGSYHNVGLFFDRLSRLSRIVNIADLQMTLASGTGDTPKLKVVGTATTFRFVDQGAAAGE